LYTGLTAWCALKIAGGLYAMNTAKKNTLVIGGSGGVGNCAIQLLKYWGAEVIVTCLFFAFNDCPIYCVDIETNVRHVCYMYKWAEN